MRTVRKVPRDVQSLTKNTLSNEMFRKAECGKRGKHGYYARQKGQDTRGRNARGRCAPKREAGHHVAAPPTVRPPIIKDGWPTPTGTH